MNLQVFKCCVAFWQCHLLNELAHVNRIPANGSERLNPLASDGHLKLTTSYTPSPGQQHSLALHQGWPYFIHSPGWRVYDLTKKLCLFVNSAVLQHRAEAYLQLTYSWSWHSLWMCAWVSDVVHRGHLLLAFRAKTAEEETRPWY